MNSLFICNQARNRSKTAAELVPGARYAGLFSEEHPVTAELMEWADHIYVFEEIQKEYLRERFPLIARRKPITNLKVPDIYDYGTKALGEAIKERLPKI